MGDFSMSNVPYFFNEIHQKEMRIIPGMVHTKNTAIVRYFQKYLIEVAISVFKFTLPESWPKNYFLYNLFLHGVIGVMKTDKYGLICQSGNIGGNFDVYYQPISFHFSNLKLKETSFIRGYNGEVIYMQPDYTGISDIINFYADLLGCCVESGATNILNSKLAYLMIAKNKSAAESLKEIIDKILSGQPAVAADSSLFENQQPAIHEFTQNLKNNFIAPDQFELFNNIYNMFYTEIGIPNGNTMKKERLITDEVNVNNVATMAKSELWFENISDSMKKVRELFNLNENELSVEWRYKDYV